MFYKLNRLSQSLLLKSNIQKVDIARNIRNISSSRSVYFSSTPNSPTSTEGDAKSKTGKNYLTALALLGFVGVIYSTALSKMKESDDLGSALEDAAKANGK